MHQPRSPGPYRMVETASGEPAPWYIIPFDKKGTCKSPLTRERLQEEVEGDSFTDIFLFSHGWNNDWETAVERYTHFIEGFSRLRVERHLDVRPNYRPLLVGVFWPSTALVMPWEAAPRFAAAAAPDEAEGDLPDDAQMIAEIVGDLTEEQGAHFRELVDNPSGFDNAAAEQLARILVNIGSVEDEIPEEEDVAPADLVAAWRLALARYPAKPSSSHESDDDAYGTIDGFTEDARPAGLLDKLDPRKVLRLTTVLQMKDRAGVVGSRGVSSLLGDLLVGNANVHLLGHSYGAKVVLAALSAGEHRRPVSSVLLLQPAVSRYCFAADAGRGQPGGFRAAFEGTKLPIMSTFSRHDAPLTRFFQLAARRKSDIGEIRVAAAAVSRYAALGGFGPGGLSPAEADEVDIRAAGESYGLGGRSAEVLALRAHDVISDHGDISKEPIWWLLYDSVAAS